LEKRFFKTFSAENSIVSKHFWGKIFPGKKMYEKLTPDFFSDGDFSNFFCKLPNACSVLVGKDRRPTQVEKHSQIWSSSP
jgi:hypothetical protein